jgi:hypothetical protein
MGSKEVPDIKKNWPIVSRPQYNFELRNLRFTLLINSFQMTEERNLIAFYDEGYWEIDKYTGVPGWLM